MPKIKKFDDDDSIKEMLIQQSLVNAVLANNAVIYTAEILDQFSVSKVKNVSICLCNGDREVELTEVNGRPGDSFLFKSKSARLYMCTALDSLYDVPQYFLDQIPALERTDPYDGYGRHFTLDVAKALQMEKRQLSST